jgi:hypothetical protein
MTYHYDGFWAPMDTLVQNRAFTVGATAENCQIRDVARIVAEADSVLGPDRRFVGARELATG